MIWGSVDDGSVQNYLQILLVPPLGRSLQQGIHIRGTRQEFSGGARASLADTRGGNQDFAGLRIENPGDDGVIIGEVLTRLPTPFLIETILNLMQIGEHKTQIGSHFEGP